MKEKMSIEDICDKAIIEKVREKIYKIDALFDEEISDDEEFQQDIYNLMIISSDALLKATEEIGEKWGNIDQSEVEEEKRDAFECIMRTYTCYVLYTFISKNRDKIMRMTEDERLSFEGIQRFIQTGLES